MVRPAPPHPRRLAYLGSPDAAVAPLRALVAVGFEIAVVVSQPDKRRGRGAALVPTPVKAVALELGLPVTERVDDVVDAGIDLGVVVAYGRIIRPHVLDAVPMVNLHFSLLPRWRGAAPVERALLSGDPVTGVCLMEVAEGLDTGGVYATVEVPIGERQTAAELREQLVDVGAALLVDELGRGLGDPEPQTGGATYAAKIDPDELRLDWTLPMPYLDRLVRVGGAWTTFRGTRLKVHTAEPGVLVRREPGTLHGELVACPGGSLRLVTVQPEGKGPMPFGAWSNGARPEPNEVLGR